MLGHQDNISQKTGEYSVFTKLTRNIDPEHLARKIRGLEVVSDVEYGISKYGMIHSVDFPLTLAGFRGVITRALTIVDIIKNLIENVPDAEGLLTISGLKEGIDVSKYLKSIMPINENNYASVLEEFYRAAGWGILEIECDPKTYEGKITVKDSFIADVYGSANQPVCAFMSGYFAGYLTYYFGKNISVREISCKVTGKNVCEHAISLAFSGVDQ
jgi:predicted hydrocarbon binding protein